MWKGSQRGIMLPPGLEKMVIIGFSLLYFAHGRLNYLMSYGDFLDILQAMTGVVKEDPYFAFLFSMRPIAILLISIGIWMMLFVVVLIFLKDESKQSALWFRLPVFSLPLAFVLAGYALRWKRQRSRDKISMDMLLACVTINVSLYKSEKPLLCTATNTRGGGFAVESDMVLNTYLDEDAEKFDILIELVTGSNDFLIQGSMPERMVVMISAAFLNKMLTRQLPVSKPERHSLQTICLCQYLELFVDDLFQSLSSDKLVREVQRVLFSRLNQFIPKERIKPYLDRLSLRDEFEFFSV